MYFLIQQEYSQTKERIACSISIVAVGKGTGWISSCGIPEKLDQSVTATPIVVVLKQNGAERMYLYDL